MTTARRRGRVVGTVRLVLIVLLGLTGAGLPAPDAPAAMTLPSAVMEIVTVPALPGLRFSVDGRMYRADHQGIVRVEVARGNRPHTVSVMDTKIHEPRRDLEFVRWWNPGDHDQDYFHQLTDVRLRRHVRIKASFRATYRVDYSFADQGRSDVNRNRVTRIEFAGDNGYTVAGDGSGRIRLVGLRPVVNGGTVIAKPVTYRVQRVDVDGSNVVQVNQQTLVPSHQTSVVVPLLLRTAHFSTRDLLFGGAVGTSVQLTYPDGRLVTVPLDASGRATVENLARGKYSVAVDAPGYSFNRPVVLSRNQYIDLPVLTYLDMGVAGGVVLMAIAVLYGLRIRSRRVARARGGGRTG